MNNELITLPTELTPDKYPVFLRAVVEQLQKDFHPYAVLDIQSAHDLSLPWIATQIHYMLTTAIAKDQHALGTIIYRVDIAERTMRQAMMNASSDERLNILTQLILKREVQKVWLRTQYQSS